MPEDQSAQSPTEAPAPAPRPRIMPTVGRVVLFYPGLTFTRNGRPIREDKGQPYPAIITHVWGPECVNIAPLPDGSFGTFDAQTSVFLKQDPAAPAPEGSYVEWMPYQVGQAQKTEKVEAVAAKVDALHAAMRHSLVGQTDRTQRTILDGAFGDPLSPQSA